VTEPPPDRAGAPGGEAGPAADRQPEHGPDRWTGEDAREYEYEVVDALPVLAEVRRLEPVRPPPVVALAQTAAVAATGFVAGVATAAVLGRRRQRRLGRSGSASPSPRPGGSLEVVSSRTYLVDVHVLERRSCAGGAS
jgi:hypothetical protein